MEAGAGMMKKGRGFRKAGDRIQSRIEVVQDIATSKASELDRADRADDDVLPYVNKLMQELGDMSPLEPISLLTPEDAEKALTTIDLTLNHLNSQLSIARSLKHLLQEKKRSE